jgi:hypothetical protein
MAETSEKQKALERRGLEIEQEYGDRLAELIFRRLFRIEEIPEKAAGWCLIFTGALFAMFIPNLRNLNEFIAYRNIVGCLNLVSVSALFGILARALFFWMTADIKETDRWKRRSKKIGAETVAKYESLVRGAKEEGVELESDWSAAEQRIHGAMAKASQSLGMPKFIFDKLWKKQIVPDPDRRWVRYLRLGWVHTIFVILQVIFLVEGCAKLLAGLHS